MDCQHLNRPWALRTLPPGRSRLRVVSRGAEQSVERAGDVAQQGEHAMQPLMHCLDSLEPVHRGAQVVNRLGALVCIQV